MSDEADDVVEMILSGKLDTAEGKKAFERMCEILAGENKRLVRVLTSAGFKVSTSTAVMLLLTGMLIASQRKQLLGALVFAMKTAQVNGLVPKPDEIVAAVERRPQLLALLSGIFLDATKVIVGTGPLPAPIRQAIEREREEGDDNISSFPWGPVR